jgi:bifunctional DNA-binding transcriptional regulator/antitoxin component of YhaV-PrlF toxin-antitoxin module
MEQMKMDEKGRVRFSKRVRTLLKLKPKQVFAVEISEKGILLSKATGTPLEGDRVLKDMIERPLQLEGMRLTKKLLDKLEDETWSR